MAENAEFAETCGHRTSRSSADADQIRQMGDKATARRLAKEPACRRCPDPEDHRGPGRGAEVAEGSASRSSSRRRRVAAEGHAHRLNAEQFAQLFSLAQNERCRPSATARCTSRSTWSTPGTWRSRSGRFARQGGAPRRARLLGAAPPPEAHRGEPEPALTIELRRAMGEAAVRSPRTSVTWAPGRSSSCSTPTGRSTSWK
jgi:hypothetical protein